MLLFVYIYIDLLKLKAYKLFENSDADLSRLLFLKKPTCWRKNQGIVIARLLSMSASYKNDSIL